MRPRLLASLVAVTALRAFAEGEAPAPAPESKPRLTIVPFTVLSAEVPLRASAKAVGMLAQEFKSTDAFVLVDAKKAAGTDALNEALSEARKGVDEAKELRAKKKFRLAEETLTHAIAQYRAATPVLPEVGELVDAWALLSAVQYNTGRDDEGAKSLSTALGLAVDRELPLAQTSTLFSRVVADARKGLKDGARGSLLIESTPEGSPVVLDGQPLGVTPLLVKEVPPGAHTWAVQLPSGEQQGGFVDVVGNKQATLKVLGANKDAESRLLTAVAQNHVDADALAAAREQAKETEAEYVLFGALTKEGKGLALDTFVLAAKTGEVRRLPHASFDTELLSVGMEFYNLASELSKKGPQVGDGVKVPGLVSLAMVGKSASTTEAKYGVVPGRDLSPDGLEADGKEPVKEEPKKDQRRAPLKKK
jgi:hypothetical protein